jgi:hypothetical protein
MCGTCKDEVSEGREVRVVLEEEVEGGGGRKKGRSFGRDEK